MNRSINSEWAPADPARAEGRIFRHKCARKACGVPGAQCQHRQTGEWYCVSCARKINEANPRLPDGRTLVQMPTIITVPAPACQFGFPQAQVETMFGIFYPRFQKWMEGQTIGHCNRLMYSPEKGEYVPSGCTEAHGYLYYPWDVERFIRGLPVID